MIINKKLYNGNNNSQNTCMKKISKDDKEYTNILSIVENCMQNTPVIILGSGASAGHGIHTMDSLAKELIQITEKSDAAKNHNNHWEHFKASMEETSNLEKSLEVIENNDELIKVISNTTWSLICKQDKSVFHKLINSEIQLPLSDVIHRLSNGTGSTSHLKIITTNYDRLAEYACDFIDDSYSEYLHYTGFSYGLIRKPDDQFNTASTNLSRRVLYRNDAGYATKINPIEILKVHGSIDWFEAEDGQVSAISFYDIMPNNSKPAIITPGKIKYERTHSRPYSTILERARQVLESTNNYLVIGFGFRDKHIHDNLERKIRARNGHKSFIILAKELTDETKKLFLSNDNVDNFVLLENANTRDTKVYKKDRNSDYEEFIITDSSLWDLNEFNKVFLQGT